MQRIFLSALLFAAATLHAADGSFEVASIKPAAPDARGMSINRSNGGRFTTSNVTLKLLITFAYNVRDFQVFGGPGWINSDHWDITAKPETAVPENDEGAKIIKGMVRTLLAERFGLEVHTDTKEMPAYALVVAKGGAKIQHSPEGGKGTSIRGSRNQLSVTNCDMPTFAVTLSNQVGRTVVDATELTGKFDFKVDFAPDENTLVKPGVTPESGAPPVQQDGPSIFTALQEQLGLRLEGKKEPVQVILIDKASKPAEN